MIYSNAFPIVFSTEGTVRPPEILWSFMKGLLSFDRQHVSGEPVRQGA